MAYLEAMTLGTALDVGGQIASWGSGLFGGNDFDPLRTNEGQLPTDAVRAAVQRMTATERQQLEAVWAGNGWKGSVPWSDPFKMAQLAAGGANGEIDSKDRAWSNALTPLVQRYATSSTGQLSPAPAAVSGTATPGAPSGSASPFDHWEIQLGNDGSGTTWGASAGQGVPQNVWPLIAIALAVVGVALLRR